MTTASGSTDRFSVIRAHIVREQDAALVSVTWNSILRTREMTRAWFKIEDQYYEQAVRLLYDYGSADNTTPQTYVTAPKTTDKETFAGTWRVVSVRGAKKGEMAGIYQTLREGWATSLSEDEARLGQVSGNAATGDFSFQRYWPNIDNTVIHTLTEGLKAIQTVTDPKVEGVTYTGTFAASECAGQVMEGDGAGIVSQRLTATWAVASATDLSGALALAHRIQVYDNDVAHPFDESSDYLQDTISSQNDVQQVRLTSISRSSFETLYGFSATNWSVLGRTNWAFVKRQISEEANNTLSVNLVFRDVTYLSASNPLHTVQESGGQIVQESSLYDQATSDVMTGAAEQGVVRVKSVNRTPTGGWDKSIRSVTSKELSATKRAVSAETDELTVETKNSRSQASPADVAVGVIEVADNSPNEDSTWDTRLNSTTSKELSATSEEKSAGMIAVTVDVKNSRSTVAAVNSQGIVQDAANKANADMTHDTRLVSKTSVPLSATHVEDSAAAIEITQIEQNSRSQYTAAGSTGIVEVARNTPNQDATWDANKSSRTSKEITTTSADRSRGEFRASTVIQNSRSSFDVPGTDEVGVTIQADNKGNADGTVDAKLDSRTSRELSATGAQVSAGMIETEAETRNSRSSFDAGAQVNGVVEVVGNRPNPDGTVDARRSSRTSVEMSATGGQISEGLIESSTNVQNSRTAAAAPASTEVGVVDTFSNRKNQDGTLDIGIQSRTSVEQSATGGGLSVGSIESATNIQNSRTAAAAPDGEGTLGVSENVSNRKNQDGTVDITISSKTSRPLSSTGMQASAGMIELDEITRNSTSQVSATNETGIVQVARNTRQDDGTYDVNLSSRTSVSQTAVGASIAAGFTESSTVVTASHTGGTVSATSTPGVTETVSNSPNVDGTQDVRLNSRTALSQTGAGGQSSVGQIESSTVILNALSEISGTSSVGVVEVWSNRPNQDGSIDASLQSRTSVEQSTTAEFINFFDVTSKTAIRNSLTAAASATAELGTVVSLDDSVNVDGSHNISIASGTEVSRTSAVFVSVFQKHSTTEYLFKNSASIPELSGSYGQVHAQWTPGGQYSGAVKEVVYPDEIDVWPSESGTTYSRIFMMFRRYSNTNWKRSGTVNVTRDFHNTYKKALTATDGGLTGLPTEQSGVVPHGRRYVSTSVGDLVLGGWTEDA